MHKFISIIGMVTFVGAAAVTILMIGGMLLSHRLAYDSRTQVILLFSLPTSIGGAVLYCFGKIVEHLQAIRAATENQPDNG